MDQPQVKGLDEEQPEDEPEEPPDELEANMDIFFFTFCPLHFGQSGGVSTVMDTSASKASPQSLHSYSYMGMLNSFSLY